MARRTNKPAQAAGQYVHKDKQRANNPQVGLVTPDTDPHLDPSLHRAGKAECTSFEVPTVSLHVHERIDPRTILNQVKWLSSDQQPGLFEKQQPLPLRDAILFYQRQNDWSNRLVYGDNLLVMNSLLQKEHMAGKVQMVYFDPPDSSQPTRNFQLLASQPKAIAGRHQELTDEPEMLAAFRETWEHDRHSHRAGPVSSKHQGARRETWEPDRHSHHAGAIRSKHQGLRRDTRQIDINTYLSYARKRLRLAWELLAESGSLLVQLQLAEAHVQQVRLVLDEIFQARNRVATITTGGRSANSSPQVTRHGAEPRPVRQPGGRPATSSSQVTDCLLWYAKDKTRLHHHQLYEAATGRPIGNNWAMPMHATRKKYVTETNTKVVQRCILMTT